MMMIFDGGIRGAGSINLPSSAQVSHLVQIGLLHHHESLNWSGQGCEFAFGTADTGQPCHAH